MPLNTERSPLIFASCRDCPSYLASTETVHDLLLPAETTVHEKWLPAETVRVILLPAENQSVSAGSYLPSTIVLTGSKRSRTVSAEAKYDGQSLQEAKISRLHNGPVLKERICYRQNKFFPLRIFLN